MNLVSSALAQEISADWSVPQTILADGLDIGGASIAIDTGQLIRTLHPGNQQVGIYAAKDKAAYWDGRNDMGEKVASGFYFYTLQAVGFKTTRRMVILK